MINEPQAVRRPRGRPRGFDCDKALLAAAETFWRLGYEGASIADLTAAMGITPQSLYGAFGSKAELYRAALTRYQETVGAFARRALVEEPTAARAFDRLLREAAHAFRQPGRPAGCMISVGGLTCAAENVEVAEHVSAMRAQMLQSLVSRIERGIAEGDLRPDTDAVRLGRYLQAVLQGMALQARDGVDERELAMIAETAGAEVARRSLSG